MEDECTILGRYYLIFDAPRHMLMLQLSMVDN